MGACRPNGTKQARRPNVTRPDRQWKPKLGIKMHEPKQTKCSTKEVHRVLKEEEQPKEAIRNITGKGREGPTVKL